MAAYQKQKLHEEMEEELLNKPVWVCVCVKWMCANVSLYFTK